ncbi:hypothetical protein FB157_1576 [Streptomyces sp. BK340]|nr:hypothetical protein FB157_1576 [Streptomyces sp. BK340]
MVPAIDFVLMPWSSAHIGTAVIALIVWGLRGWGFITTQTHRLIGAMPATAPMPTGLHSATLYVRVSIAPVVGRGALNWADVDRLGPIGAALTVLVGGAVEITHLTITRHHQPAAAPVPARWPRAPHGPDTGRRHRVGRRAGTASFPARSSRTSCCPR